MITSENQIVCFPSFVLSVIWYSTSYYVIVLLWEMLMELVNAPARWWPWARLNCISGLPRPENTLKFWYAYMSWPRAQIWFRHKWGKLVTASLLLDCIDWYSCLRYWNEFFAAVFQVLDWSFLVLRFDGNVCNWIPKVMWPRMDWFWGFLLENGFFRWIHICMDWNLLEMLKCYSILTKSIFFDV